MNTAGKLILGTFVAMTAMALAAQGQTLAPAGSDRQIGASSTSAAREPSGSPPVFTLGGLPVHVWAPVPPYYNARANRNLAADPLWGPNW